MSILARKLLIAAPSGPVAFTLTATNPTISNSGQVATITGASIGTASSDRIVVIGFIAQTGGTAQTWTATIDYGGGDIAMNATAKAESGWEAAIMFWLPVPTGTTATFKITTTAGSMPINDAAVVYAVTGANETPNATGTDVSDAMDTDPLTTGSVTIPAGGGFVAVANGEDDVSAYAWANATETVDLDAGVIRLTSATRTTSGTVTITCTQSTGSATDEGALAYIIFNSL